MNYLFEKILKIVSGVILILISLSLLITGIAPNNFIINAKTAFDFINGGFSVLSFYSIFIIFLFVILFLSLGLLLLFSTASNSKERIKVLESNYGNVFVSQFVVGDLIKHCLTNYEGIKLKNYKLDYLNNNINLVLNVVLKTFLDDKDEIDINLKNNISETISEYLNLSVINIAINYEYENVLLDLKRIE